MTDLAVQYKKVRQRTEQICAPLQTEDYVVQPVADVSPPKWHIGHTTWFFETFILMPYFTGYQEYDPNYNYVFNSYYETVGNRVIRTDRGNLSRPTVMDIQLYRKYVDNAMEHLLCGDINDDIKKLLILGFNHEEQHQELLLTDIKYILGHNPLFPPYSAEYVSPKMEYAGGGFIKMEEGIYEIGFKGNGFCFDNELNRHKVYLNVYEINTDLVTNAEYMEFIDNGGYHNFRHWHAAGWDWVNQHKVESPMYWHLINGKWHNYTYHGLQLVHLADPVCHISYYEAYAYASWKGMRLPTEFEWEAAATRFKWGKSWEWTESAYLPYPGFAKAPGAIGEYNGKFMVGQKVLRGASEATSPGHSRITYRNFFNPNYAGNLLAYALLNKNTISNMAPEAKQQSLTDNSNTASDNIFYDDVIRGLTAATKRLDSKYFYDSNGDKIFQELMNCDEYYPTNCEMEIFTSQTAEICKAIAGAGDAFDLIELGAGDATKSTRLLKYLIDEQVDFNYLPIDISENVISYLNITLPVTLRGIKITGLNGEYFEMLKKAEALSGNRKVVMFLGSNIGNMPVAAAQEFCRELRKSLSAGDMVLIGIDLKKNPKTVLAAYNDKEGITRRFNLNLLKRINRELDGNFEISRFDHYATYDPETGSCKSYLISLADQQVQIGRKTLSFLKDEHIYMEISQKYTQGEIDSLATGTGFKPVDQFYDSRKWFTDAIWVAE